MRLCSRSEKKLRTSRCFCFDFNSFGVSLVGFQGQNSLFSYGGDLDEAKSVFRKKYVEQRDYDIAMYILTTLSLNMTTVQHIPCMKAVPQDDIRQMNVFFFRRFSEKTRNKWEDKDSFTKIAGKYDLIIVDYNAEVTQTSRH